MEKRFFVRNTKVSVIVLTAFSMLAVIVFFLSFPLTKVDKQQLPSLKMKNRKTILYSHKDNDKYYLFLPSGMETSDFERDDAALEEITIVNLNGLPSLFIDVTIGNIEKVDEDVDKNTKVRASFSFYDENGNLSIEETGSVKGRGNTTWMYYDKKPYNISLDEPIDIMGMGEAEKWCLLSNTTDIHYFSNKMVYDFASKFDVGFVPDCRFVNVFINGNYNGLYLLYEKIEVGENRFNLNRENLFLLETDINYENDKLPYCFYTDGVNIFEIHYPTIVDPSSLDAISKEVQELENALVDMKSDRWKTMVDIDSWARVYLIDEFFENEDGGFCSVYMYKNKDGLFARGPIWDYDRILNYGSDLIMVGNAAKYSYEVNVNYNYSPLQRPEFQKRVSEIYQKEFLPLAKKEIPNSVLNCVSMINDSLNADCIRWNSKRPQKGFEEELLNLIDKRSEFLLNYFSNRDEYCKVQIEDDFGYLRNFIVWIFGW